MVNVFIVVIDELGNVVTYKSISSEEYKDDFKALSAAVDKEHQYFLKKYSSVTYTINVGVGDSLVSVLRSFPEMRSPWVPA